MSDDTRFLGFVMREVTHAPALPISCRVPTRGASSSA